MATASELIGQRFGRLTVLAVTDERDACRRIKLLCKCECGQEAKVIGSSLRNGHSRSCGCAQREWAQSGNARAGTGILAIGPTGSVESGGPRVDCIEWQGARTRGDYGRVYANGRNQLAHRVAYEAAFGPIPAGMQVCHRCDNPPCVNPIHLFLGTNTDNQRDAVRKGRKHQKLSGADVERIRHRLVAGERQFAIASSAGITQTMVSRIARGDAWGEF